MKFTKEDFRKAICTGCTKYQTEECTDKIESTGGSDFGGTMKCTDFEYKESGK